MSEEGEEKARALRARRVELGLTQEEVRARSGLSVTTIAKIESGDPTVSRASLRRYDEVLNWQPGTAEGIRAGLTPTDVSELIEELAPLVAERLRANRQAARTISVEGLPEEIVVGLEHLVVNLRRALARGGPEAP